MQLTNHSSRHPDSPKFSTYSLHCSETQPYHASLIKLMLMEETSLHSGKGSQFTPYIEFPQTSIPMKSTRQKDILLPSLPNVFYTTGT